MFSWCDNYRQEIRLLLDRIYPLTARVYDPNKAKTVNTMYRAYLTQVGTLTRMRTREIKAISDTEEQLTALKESHARQMESLDHINELLATAKTEAEAYKNIADQAFIQSD